MSCDFLSVYQIFGWACCVIFLSLLCVGGLTPSREEGINNWCHDVIDGNVYAVYLVEQVWTGVKSTITEENVCIL